MDRGDLAVADGEELVDVGGLPLRAVLDHPLARVVVAVALRPAVVGELLDAVLLVPEDRPAGADLEWSQVSEISFLANHASWKITTQHKI